MVPNWLSKNPVGIEPFQLFSTEHLATLAVILMVLWLLNRTLGKLTVNGLRRYEIAMALFMLALEITYKYWRLVIVESRLVENLNLNLCGMVVLLAIYHYIRPKNQLRYELIYYWALAGATQAMLTPDLAYGFGHYRYFHIFLSHALMIQAALHFSLHRGMRPRRKSLPITLALTAGIALPIYIINRTFDTNYLFLLRKPQGLSLLDAFGPWPYYLVGLFLMGSLLFTLLWLPHRHPTQTPEEG
jgi:hypothetical integral membrane protein (TIGR02206 family)